MTDHPVPTDAQAAASAEAAAFPVVAQVVAHWASLRRQGRLPRRDALDPRALADALGRSSWPS